ncbi:MAG: HNH endonuclease signature motif containing protein [Vicinamibacterales bacterium]
MRARKLREQPFCSECEARGAPVTPTTDVDHRMPHRGDKARFFDYENLDALCRSCHSRKTQRGG